MYVYISARGRALQLQKSEYNFPIYGFYVHSRPNKRMHIYSAWVRSHCLLDLKTPLICAGLELFQTLQLSPLDLTSELPHSFARDRIGSRRKEFNWSTRVLDGQKPSERR